MLRLYITKAHLQPEREEYWANWFKEKLNF